jgi:L-histidine Nalpha-methyltransferase
MPTGETAAGGADVSAAEVAEYLQREPRQLPTRYLYDALGSALFDAICHLPWYRVTRAEQSLLERQARDILATLRRPLAVAELGCGNGDKLAMLIEHAREPVGLVQLVDISAAALGKARDRLATLQVDDLIAHRGTYEEGLDRIAASRRTDEALLVLFLGSNLGNFDPPAAHDLLVRIHASLRPGDALLIGTDLIKPVADLLAAYDDPLGVTAAFNRNLLQRLNTEVGATFDLDGFGHRAVWNADAHRVEMHLVSRRHQSVRLGATGLEVAFAPDDWIWTESSYKFEPGSVVALGRAAGFAHAQQWVEADAGFALTRFGV